LKTALASEAHAAEGQQLKEMNTEKLRMFPGGTRISTVSKAEEQNLKSL
jgi:hypothetical protein